MTSFCCLLWIDKARAKELGDRWNFLKAVKFCTQVRDTKKKFHNQTVISRYINWCAQGCVEKTIYICSEGSFHSVINMPMAKPRLINSELNSTESAALLRSERSPRRLVTSRVYSHILTPASSAGSPPGHCAPSATRSGHKNQTCRLALCVCACISVWVSLSHSLSLYVCIVVCVRVSVCVTLFLSNLNRRKK